MYTRVFEAEMTMGQRVSGSRVKWVNKSESVTCQYS